MKLVRGIIHICYKILCGKIHISMSVWPVRDYRMPGSSLALLKFFLCTHTYAHKCTHTHTHQCPDIPGLWKDTCSYLNKIKSDTTWKQATRVYSSNGWSAEITYSNPKPHISMSVWKMTNYRIPMISLTPQFFLYAYIHTCTHTHTCVHTFHTSVQINLGFERIFAAPLIKSNPIPHT